MDDQKYQLPSDLKLNLGCGSIQPHDWVNIDGSNRAWLANRLAPLDRMLVKINVLPPTDFGPQVQISDLLKPLPYGDNSVGAIYAGEVWEHFEYADSERLTRECFRVLAPGGVLRVCVPDGVEFWKNYLALVENELAKPRAKRSAERIRKHVHMYFQEICTRRIWLGSMGHTHKWQFDEVQLVELFETIGFTDVDRMPFQTSRISDVAVVERSAFLIVEGVKPRVLA